MPTANQELSALDTLTSSSLATKLYAVDGGVSKQITASAMRGFMSPVRNVLDYGADPTGIADSSAAIQDAIDASVGADGGGIVYIPSGDYLIATSLILYSGVILQGMGAGSIPYSGSRLVAANTLNDYVIKSNNIGTTDG